MAHERGDDDLDRPGRRRRAIERRRRAAVAAYDGHDELDRRRRASRRPRAQIGRTADGLAHAAPMTGCAGLVGGQQRRAAVPASRASSSRHRLLDVLAVAACREVPDARAHRRRRAPARALAGMAASRVAAEAARSSTRSLSWRFRSAARCRARTRRRPRGWRPAPPPRSPRSAARPGCAATSFMRVSGSIAKM